MPLRALTVDFNSYFASVGQQERPALRGRPVGIVPVLARPPAATEKMRGGGWPQAGRTA